MAPTDRLTTGSILVLALVLLTGFALVAGPTLAQETTEDGMDGNETMTDGTETMDNDTMDDSMATETENGNESMTEEESMDDGSMTETMDDESMTEEESMDDESMTEDDMSDEEMADETASGGQPGFGVVVGLVALAAAAGAVLYRRRG